MAWAECDPIVETYAMALFLRYEIVCSIYKCRCNMHTPTIPRLAIFFIADQEVAPFRQLAGCAVTASQKIPIELVA